MELFCLKSSRWAKRLQKLRIMTLTMSQKCLMGTPTMIYTHHRTLRNLIDNALIKFSAYKSAMSIIEGRLLDLLFAHPLLLDQDLP